MYPITFVDEVSGSLLFATNYSKKKDNVSDVLLSIYNIFDYFWAWKERKIHRVSTMFIALGSNLVQLFWRWRCIFAFPGQSNNNHVLSCLLFNRPGNTATDRPRHLATKDEYRPERYSFKLPFIHVFFRHMRVFRDTLMMQGLDFVTDEMTIEAHLVRQSDLKRHISEKDIHEIVSGQSQKREWSHRGQHGQPPQKKNSNTSNDSSSTSSNGSHNGHGGHHVPSSSGGTILPIYRYCISCRNGANVEIFLQCVEISNCG